MIALLGVMMAVMSILAVLVTIFFAILGFFGYKSIEERSVNAAEKKAAEIAEVMVVKSIADFRAKEQAVAMGAGQPLTDQKKKHEKPKANPAKITSDSSLRDKGKNNDAH